VAFLAGSHRASAIFAPQLVCMTPLSHESFGDLFDSAVPGIVHIDGQSVVASDRIVQTKQGSKVEGHRARKPRVKKQGRR